ncbi:MAG: hypothetical protein U0270_41120 [Labilithrix sp.]
MRKARFLFGLGAAASWILGLVHCSDDPENTTPDGGSPEASVDGSSDAKPSGDSSTVADGGATRAIAMNALVTVESPIRFCFLASKSGPPTLADGVDSPPVPAAALSAGALTETGIPRALADSHVRIVVYYEESLSAFGLSGKTCKELAAISTLAPVVEPPDSGVDASDDAGDPDAGDADASEPDADAGDAGDDADAGDGAAPMSVPMGGGPGGLELVQFADFDISEEVIPPATIKPDATYLLYASGCTHRQAPNRALLYCNNDKSFGEEPFQDFYAWLIELDTTSAAPPAGQSRVQVVQTDDLWRLSGLFNYREVGATYGDASVPFQGPGDPSNPDGGATFPYVVASGPAHPGTLVPTVSTASSFYFIPPGFPAQVFPTAETLQLSGLTQADLGSATSFTLVQLGNGVDETEKLPDGKPNPRFLGFRIIRNK